MGRFICVAVCVLSCAENPSPFENDTPPRDVIACHSVGGVCTETRDIICSPGRQPVTDNDLANTDCEGHCCVEVGFTICNDNPQMNCIPDACTGHWQAVEGGENLCELNRVCCFWMP